MSASSKKKLRAEGAAAKMTERQLAEQKEAKKVKIYTIAFVAVLVLLIVVAIVAGVSKTITGSGMRERNTTALTVGNHNISNAELNYYLVDAVNTFYSQNGAYAAFYGLDTSKPLDQQYIDEEANITWADNFIDAAKNNAISTYALADEAEANGFVLPEDEMAQVDALEMNMKTYAALSGASDADTYLKAYYGNGARVSTFKEYFKRNLLASAYQASYVNGLTYTDEQIRAQEATNPGAYSSFTYNQYYLSTSRFLTGGTAGEDGSMVYSDEERAAANRAAEEAVKTLVTDEITSVEKLDEAIAALPINAETPAQSTAFTNQQYTALNSKIVDWVSDSSRKEGDVTYLPSSTTTTDENGNEETTLNGFYVVYFINASDNKVNMINVRHILTGFEGGTTEDGVTTYSDAEKQAAKAAAEEILNQWKSGDATEDSFAQLAAEKSTDTGSKANGGLYENVYPNQMVPAFNDWCFDQNRKAGDTGIVETEYGYHTMYFVGTSDMTYRDFLISSELRDADASEWYNNLINSVSTVDGDTSYLTTGLVLGGNQ